MTAEASTSREGSSAGASTSCVTWPARRSATCGVGVVPLGWDMLAATRLGFPYDFWGQGDKREVEPFDVVDTMTYRRLLEPGEREYRTTPMAGYIERFKDMLPAVAQHGLERLGMTPVGNSPAEAREFVERERARWNKVIETEHITAG